MQHIVISAWGPVAVNFHNCPSLGNLPVATCWYKMWKYVQRPKMAKPKNNNTFNWYLACGCKIWNQLYFCKLCDGCNWLGWVLCFLPVMSTIRSWGGNITQLVIYTKDQNPFVFPRALGGLMSKVTLFCPG